MVGGGDLVSVGNGGVMRDDELLLERRWLGKYRVEKRRITNWAGGMEITGRIGGTRWRAWFCLLMWETRRCMLGKSPCFVLGFTSLLQFVKK